MFFPTPEGCPLHFDWSDFDYAFEHDYVDQKWAQEDPNRQISSAEFKLMLTRMIESTVPDRLPWFNSKVSDDDMPASREVGTLMSWYAAVALGQDVLSSSRSLDPDDCHRAKL